LVVIVHCADPAFDHAHYLERIRASLQFDALRFAVNRPFVAIKNGKHRFVMRVDKVEAALGEMVAC
jgi:phenylacetate-CoA ligase